MDPGKTILTGGRTIRIRCRSVDLALGGSCKLSRFCEFILYFLRVIFVSYSGAVLCCVGFGV